LHSQCILSGHSIDQKRRFEPHDGFAELLIPPIATVGVACRHRFAPESFSEATEFMPEQRRADLESHTEILKRRGEGMAFMPRAA
jgi:hypothetical protein